MFFEHIHRPAFYFKHKISETGFSLRLHAKFHSSLAQLIYLDIARYRHNNELKGSINVKILRDYLNN
jgi:hypothetical protein